MTNMIKDIEKALREKYPNAEITIEYDYRPSGAESVLGMVEVARESDEVGDWLSSGDVTILRSKSDGEECIDIILLKRGVVIEMEFPRGSEQSASEEED